jgi:lysozyme family protein
MANFEKAYEKTLNFEGGYSNDPNDAGGETYKGIARTYNGDWDGWVTIDECKKMVSCDKFPDCLDDKDDLQDNVHAFYKKKYWDINKLDDFASQDIAEEMFDTGVNMGVGRAAKFLQKSLNYLNRNGSLYSDLVVDGAIGGASLSALNKVLSGGDDKILLTMLNVLQGNHYMEYMDKDPIQRKYARGWFKRVYL